MIKKIDANKYGVVRYAISSIEDIADLPREVSVGSEAILVNEDGEKKFRLGSDGWVEVVEVKEYDEDKLKDILEDAKVGYGGIEYETLEERLDKDFDNVYSVLDNRTYVEYEGCKITAKDSLNGLQKETVIKGRTLQNIVKSYKASEFMLTNAEIVSEGVFKLSEGTDINHTSIRVRVRNHLYKPNTTYTVFVDILENTTGKKLGISNIYSMINDGYARDFQNLTGVSCFRFTTTTDGLTTKGVEPTQGLYFGIWDANDTSGEFSKYIKFKYWILEGDHTQTPLEELPFIEGIESVGDKSKNLFDSVLLNNKINNSTGIIIDRYSNEHYSSDFIQCDSLKTYTVSTNYNNTVSELMLFEYDYEKNFIKKNSKKGVNSLTVTLSNDTKYVRLSSFKGYGFNEYNFDFQLEEGTQATSYEPYYDGYKISGKSCGKNLLNINSNENIVDSVEAIIDGNTLTVTQIEEGSWRYYGVKLNNLKPNTTYTCSATIIGDSPCRVRIFDIKTYKEIAHFNSYNGKVSFTPTINLDSIWALFYTSYNKTMPVGTVAIFKDIMLEEGTTATPYEPYKETTYSYILDEPLRSLPDGVCDEIDLEKGVVTRRVGEAVLCGNEVWELYDDGINVNGNGLYNFRSGHISTFVKPYGAIVCDSFRKGDVIALTNYESFLLGDRTLYIRKKIGEEITDVITFKQWLSKNPVTIHYELEEPTIEYLIKEDKFVTLPNGVKDEVGRIVTRNVDKIVFDGSNDELWQVWEAIDATDVYGFAISVDNLTQTYANPLVCNTFGWASGFNSSTNKEEIFNGDAGRIGIKIFKNKLADGTVEEFRKWLSQNPTTVYYQVATPYIECSYEKYPTLPNGVEDKISYNSVLRKVGKITLNGSSDENWKTLSPLGSTDTIAFQSYLPYSKPSSNNKIEIMCDTLTVYKANDLWYYEGTDNICAHNSSNNYQIRINKNELSEFTVEELKKWLSRNPITVYYQLETPYIDPINLDEVILDTICLKSYEPITHITSDNYLPPTIKTQVPSDFNAVVLGLKSNNEALASQVMSLRQTNDELEATNREQDDVIDVTLLALDEVYGMIDEGEVETMSTGSPMVNVYVKMIKRGIKTLDEVPAKYRAEVEELI